MASCGRSGRHRRNVQLKRHGVGIPGSARVSPDKSSERDVAARLRVDRLLFASALDTGPG